MTTTQDDLKYGVEYWEKLLSDMDDLKERLKEHKAALKAKGYNVKMVGQLVAIRRKDKSDEASQDINDLLLYAAATGTNLNVITELEPTPIEAAIQASKAADAVPYDEETGEVLDDPEEGMRARGVDLRDTATHRIVEKFGRNAETLYATGSIGGRA